MANVGSQIPVFQGAWSDQPYLRGDLVLRSGVLYQAVTDTTAQPGATSATPNKGNPASWVNVTAVVLDFTGATDPTAGSGIPSAISSTYHMAGTGLYVKTGSGATAWGDAGAPFPDSWTVSEDGLQVNGTIGAFDETPIVAMQVSAVGGGESAAVVSVVSTRGGYARVSVIGSGADGESITLGGEGAVQIFTETGVKGIEAWDGPGNVLRFGLLPTGGHVVIGTTGAPPDSDLSASQVAFWFDDTDGAAKLKIKGKSANGTVVTGSVNLT